MNNLNQFAVRRTRVSRSLALAVLLALGMGTQVQAGSTVGLSITGGNNQIADPGTPFPAPLSVRYVDAKGDPIPDQRIDFTVIPTNGADATLSVTSIRTDQSGSAATQATAGQIAGTYVVNASIGGGKLGAGPQGTIESVEFNLTNRGTPQQATALPAFSTTAALMLIGLLGFAVWRRKAFAHRQ